MSLKYRDSQGNETPVAGLNGTSGELVPSTALMKSGVASVSMPNTSSLDQLFTVQVTFDTPFEDANYVLNVDQCEVSEAEINRVFDKTASGFYIAVMYNRQRTTVPSYNVTARIPWQAFKLMTDEVREADSAHIAQNTANFAPAFSEVTSYAVGDYVTYNNILYRCTTAHTAGVWVAGHFTQVTVGEVLSDISGVVSNVDCDTLTTVGAYSTAGANTPESGYWFMVVVQYAYINATKYIMQSAYSVADATKNYRRVSSDGGATWTTWLKLVTENDLKPYYHKCIYARTNTSGAQLIKTLVAEDGKCYIIEGYQGDNYRRTRAYYFSGSIRTINEVTTEAAPFTLSVSANVITITFAAWGYNQCRIYEESPANGTTIG